MIPESLNTTSVILAKVVVGRELKKLKSEFPKVKIDHYEAFDPTVATELILAYTHLSNAVEMIEDAESPES